MIKPTIGRIVWYWPQGQTEFQGQQPNAAIVCYVHGDRMVNLAWFDSNGVAEHSTSVTLVQEGDDAPLGGFCTWMPYQIGQATRAEAAK